MGEVSIDVCPPQVEIIGTGRMHPHLATCSSCSTFYQSVERAAAHSNTMNVGHACRDIQAMVDTLSRNPAPPVDELVPIFLHHLGCKECRQSITGGGVGFGRHVHDHPVETENLGAAGDEERDERFEPGQMIGRFEIVGKLGQGGMGVVVSARDPNLDRVVAIKLVKGRGQSREMSDYAGLRLIREAQAMARIRHPNVLTVYEAGRVEELVFIVMDMIEGTTLGTWLQQSKRVWQEILSAFLRAGAGLAAAHKAGLFHRDFKPENVLISQDGGIYVTDFGLVGTTRESEDEAKLRESSPSLSRRTGPVPDALVSALTREGELMGTPRYMSPEQHQAQATDARTDQFSFCVALWEALYGVLPFEGESYFVWVANVCEGKIVEPPADTTVPAWITPILKKGLSPKPDDRYPSMDELLEQLKIPSAKRRGPLIAAIAGGVAVAATAGALIYARHHAAAAPNLCTGATEQAAALWNDATKDTIAKAFAATGRAYAADTFTRVVPTVAAYATQWANMEAESCRAARIQGYESEAMLDRRAACLDRRRAALQALLDLWKRPDDEIVANALGSVQRLPAISDCTAGALNKAADVRPTDPAKAHKLDSLQSRLGQGSTLLGAGKYREGIAIAKEVCTAADDLRFLPFTAESNLVLGELQWRAGMMSESTQTLERAYEAAEAANNALLKVKSAIELTYVVGTQQQQLEDGQRWARLARASLDSMGGDPRLEAQLLRNAGTMLFKAERYEEALADHQESVKIRERAFGPDSIEVAESLRGVGTVMIGMGKATEAITVLQHTLDIATRYYGDHHPELGDYLNNLGGAYAAQGDVEKARELFNRALKVREEALGSSDVELADSLSNIATLDCDNHECDKAIPYYERAAKLEEAAYGPDNTGLAETLTYLGFAQSQVKQFEPAMTNLRRAIAIDRKARSKNLAFALGIAGATAFELAQAMWSEASRRYDAVAIAQEAAGDLREAGTDQDTLDEVERWLADHHASRPAP